MTTSRASETPRGAIFRRFLLSYLAILLIPILLGSYAYREAVDVARRASIQARLSMLEHSIRLIDQNLREIDEMVLQISLDPDLSALRYVNTRDLDATDVMRLIEAKTKSAFFRVTNDFKRRFYIYYTQSEVIVSNNRVNTGLGFHYASFLNYPEMDFASWQRDVLGGDHRGATIPAGPVLIDESEHRVLTYLRSLPRTQSGQLTGVVAFLIDEDALMRLLQDSSSAAESYIVDPNGVVLARSPGIATDLSKPFSGLAAGPGHATVRVDGREMVAVGATSGYNGWRYVSLVPADLVLNRVEYVRRLTFGIVASALALGVISALLLADAYAKPLRDILAKVRDPSIRPPSRSDLAYLVDSVSSLIERNDQLEIDVETQGRALESMLIAQVVRGGFANGQELLSLQARSGIELVDGCYVVIVVRTPGPDGSGVVEERERFRTVLSRITGEASPFDAYQCTLSTDEWVVLLSFGPTEGDRWRHAAEAFVRSLACELEGSWAGRQMIGVGGRYDRTRDVHHSYREAKFAVEAASQAPSTGVRWYSEIAHGGGYYYPVELELRLINNAKSGNRDEVAETLALVHKKNDRESGLSPAMSRALVSNMLGSLVKLASDVALPDEVSERILTSLETDYGDSQAAFHAVGTLYSLVCDAVDAAKKSHNTAMVRRMIDIIHSRYAEWDLSPRRVAVELGLSEHYVSHFFKEQTGETFSSFLERTRIQVACAVLSEGRARIQDAAARVGYTNVYTFRRAFKRVTGVVPTEYSFT